MCVISPQRAHPLGLCAFEGTRHRGARPDRHPTSPGLTMDGAHAGANTGSTSPSDERPSGGGPRMNRASVVVVGLLCAVLGMPQTTSAAGSYGAVVEKRVRGCTTDPASRVVICFESPSVNSQSRGVFLQAWRAAHVYLARWDTGPPTLRVRAVSVTVTAASSPTSRPGLTYLATADL